MPERKKMRIEVKSNNINVYVERECTQEECLWRCDSMPLIEFLIEFPYFLLKNCTLIFVVIKKSNQIKNHNVASIWIITIA